MRIIETKVYKYDELTDKAKAKARDWWREASAGDNFFADYAEEDFRETLKALGFDPYRYTGGNGPTAGKRSTVAWSGFGSQGDGAAFGGTWRASRFAPDALLENRPQTSATPNSEIAKHADNVELHRIAGEIRACVAAGMTFASISVSSWGVLMSLDSAEHDQPEGITDIDKWTAHCADNEVRFIEAARDLARAFYKALEAEYEYQNSDEQVAESIIANDYEFTEEGERA